MDLPLSLVEALRSLSRREGATLFMTLLAAFQALLHRYSGQVDIVVGIPIAGRTRMEVEALIGFFVNMLVLRTDASGDPTFRELLGRVGKVAFEGVLPIKIFPSKNWSRSFIRTAARARNRCSRSRSLFKRAPIVAVPGAS